ncbi:hypothetical protein CIB84_004945, partial [Bambusicola thoracicus]
KSYVETFIISFGKIPSDLQNNIFQYDFADTVRLQSDSNDNEDIEQIDEDIAVTQSQMNFICPITQVEMKKPVRNKVCGHSYEEDAILKIIQTRKQQKKKVRREKHLVLAPYEGYGEKGEGMQYAVDDSKPATLRDRNVARRMELGDSS